MDQRVLVHQLRHLLQMTTLNASESGLRALIMRHLRKPAKSPMDRDKIDFLMVQYFALCVPTKIYHKQIELNDVAQVMKPVLGETDTAPLPWCEPLEKMIVALRPLKSVRDILKTDFIEQGRRVKEKAGGMFYDPSAMLAFVRFNFLLRRTLIELMHADLIFIRSGINHLEQAGAKTVDCQTYGLTAAEPIAQVRALADDWKQPFQKEYTERSVSQAFEKLLALRADVDRAAVRVLGKSLDTVAIQPTAEKAVGGGNSAVATPGAARPSEKAEAAANSKSEEAKPELDFESCMEQVWEQLIAAPPSRGRSMTTVRVGGARLLMSSWEVAAFVTEDGPAAEDLRRAVVARALVSAAMEKANESGNATGLDRVLPIARVEVSRLQERVELAKQAKDTEAAVNLGISTKRLLSALDEAEKL
jgi:ribosomal protein L12E/L44/L45/RPP1/RPP2